ncbi:MAG: hypothetical protein ACFFAY_08350 [Promethearchaeota archaeon]
MTAWEQWLRDFMRSWFGGLVDGIWDLEKEDRNRLISSLQMVVTEFDEFKPFLIAWMNIEDRNKLKQDIQASFDSITEFDNKAKHFFQIWYGALILGVQELETASVGLVFRYTGEKCAESFAKSTFLETWKESQSFESFIAGLNQKIGDGAELFQIIDDNTIEATYPRCFCPLVDFGLVSSPLICNCSDSWLKSNFKSAMRKDVVVDRLESVRSGSDKCRFRIRFND